MRVGKGYGQSGKSGKPMKTHKADNSVGNIRQLDPTRTASLRLSFSRALVARANRLKGDLYGLVHDKDILGKRPTALQPTYNETYTYASTQVDVTDVQVLAAIKELQDGLDPEDVIKYDNDTHITVRYGLHQQEDTARLVKAIVGGSGDILVSLGNLSVFSVTKAGESFDVLKVEVRSPDLHELNARLGFLPNTQTYDYNPHMTIAYMKAGTAKRYEGTFPNVTGRVLRFTTVQYSATDGAKTPLSTHPYLQSNVSLLETQLAGQLDTFKDWLGRKLGEHLTGASEESEWGKYTIRAYQRGVLQAYNDMSKKMMGMAIGDRNRTPAYQGQRLQFISDTTRQAMSSGTLRLLIDRTFSDISGVAGALSTHLSRTFSDGMISSKDTKSVAGQMIRDTERIANTRLRAVASMSVVRAYNEGKLDAYKSLGVTEVGVDVEWSTGQQRTCPTCQDLSTSTFSIDDARGRLPVHVGCSCAWVPASMSSKQSGRVSSSVALPSVINHECAHYTDLFDSALTSCNILPNTVG